MGQFTQHFSNLLLASQIGEHSGLECEWYLNNLMSDCSIGVLLCYLYLHLLLKMLSGTRFEFTSGDYGQGELLDKNDNENNSAPVQELKSTWTCNKVLCQLFWWVVIVILVKLSTLSLLLIFSKWVEPFGKMLLNPVKDDPKLKLIFVMMIFPTIFNVLQFWFTDNIIKNKVHDKGMLTQNENLNKSLPGAQINNQNEKTFDNKSELEFQDNKNEEKLSPINLDINSHNINEKNEDVHLNIKNSQFINNENLPEGYKAVPTNDLNT
jgi:hypothetical protein